MQNKYIKTINTSIGTAPSSAHSNKAELTKCGPQQPSAFPANRWTYPEVLAEPMPEFAISEKCQRKRDLAPLRYFYWRRMWESVMNVDCTYYVLVYSPDSAFSSMQYDCINHDEARNKALRKKRHDLTGPVAIVVIGPYNGGPGCTCNGEVCAIEWKPVMYRVSAPSLDEE